MAQNVGGTGCTFVKGTTLDPKERVQTWMVPGMDGYGSQLLGLAEAEFGFELVLFDTLTNVQSWAATIQALQGSVVNIEDDFGTVYTNMLLVRVDRVVKTPAYQPPNALYRGSIQIQGVKVA